ncbi:MAG: FkbM family methyltransferase [Hyphomonadaceae bacterium]|nr:FkbM family methyltransferase [Hyphomonadaceae bacterium]
MHSNQRTINFGQLSLLFDKRDPSVQAYAERSWFEEFNSQFYGHINQYLSPELLVDVGANYGVASVFMKQAMPGRQLVSIEPNSDLIYFIKTNISQNGFSQCRVLQAVVGEETKESVSFFINPRGSQDSRVIAGGQNWRQIEVRQKTLSEIIADYNAKSAFIKIDSQGWEQHIFIGADQFLKSSNEWLIKTEFAPDWLVSQGTDPLGFLTYLIKNFTVAEFPARYGFEAHYTDLLKNTKINLSAADRFLDYVVNLNRNKRGWVDLLVAPLT